MKQDITRDYITDCFRYYASVKAGRAKPETDAELADIAAAESTLKELGRIGKRYIADAIRAVYMVDQHKPLHTKSIALRVRRFAITEAHADTSTVYRWLQEGRRICARKRMLRVR